MNMTPISVESKDYAVDRQGDGVKVIKDVAYITVDDELPCTHDSIFREVGFYNSVFVKVGFAFINDLISIKEIDNG